jgi:hypothetical protein
MHKKVDRARLFLIFDALKGFKELLLEKNYVKTNIMNLTGKFIKFKKEMK